MTAAPHGPGDTASLYRAVSLLYALLTAHPNLAGQTAVIHANGRIEISADGTSGVLRDWTHALPDHMPRPGLTTTFYGFTETDVLKSGSITVTIRHPLAGPGGAV